MQSVSFLDDLVARFRHRWNTDSQYRAMMSGLCAVVVLIALCSCAGIVSTVTNNVFSGSGLASGGGSSPGSVPGGGLLQGAASFPTASLPPWTPGTIPNANPAPASQTPPPTPTIPPTPTPTPTGTPCTSNCGGGGGGHVTVTVTGWSPSQWKQGSNISVTVHTSVPYDGVNLIITACDGSTQLSSNGSSPSTDGNGNYTFAFTQSGPSSRPSADVWVTAQNGSGAGVHASPPCG